MAAAATACRGRGTAQATVPVHVTNAAPLRCALEILRSRYDDLLVAVSNTATLSPRVARAFNADAADSGRS